MIDSHQKVLYTKLEDKGIRAAKNYLKSPYKAALLVDKTKKWDNKQKVFFTNALHET